uniref:Non-canonical purine NTP phosphatase/PRRC1 domain-containing protein n=1 Tax=Clastoptera arizonana TaxID=38151 RepID=A0A1B6C033_9HEMI
MQEDSSNGESTFEFIEKKSAGVKSINNQSTAMQEQGAVASTSTLLSNLGPPSALPTFVPLPSDNKSTLAFHSTTFSPVLPVDKNSIDSNSNLSASTTPASTNSSGGLFSWVKDTVGNNITKVAEKAKSSVDSMITTLDPQMRDFLSNTNNGELEIIIASDKEVKISPIREAFQSVFGRVNVRGLAAHVETIAAQPVGFEAGLKGAWLRIEALRQLYPEGPIVAVENFLVTLSQDRWYDVGAIVLSDVSRGLSLELFTQLTPVPTAIVTLSQEDTPADYPFANTGFAVTIGSLMGKNLHVRDTNKFTYN